MAAISAMPPVASDGGIFGSSPPRKSALSCGERANGERFEGGVRLFAERAGQAAALDLHVEEATDVVAIFAEPEARVVVTSLAHAAVHGGGTETRVRCRIGLVPICTAPPSII